MAFSPINPSYPVLWHGGDYNPDQWLGVPGILDEDIRLMGLAGINTASIGIFSWASLEPEEGKFDFSWMDRVMDMLANDGRRAVLATPSGGKPNWLALKYPEVRRVQPNGLRDAQALRHNHCPTSPVYREKVLEINTRLAERYKDHPALVLWHLSNEYGGHCHCDLCFAAFRTWLEARYETPEKMNDAFWSRFWSHSFTSFAQVTTIDGSVHGLALAWKRFMTDQLISFIKNESEPLRRLTPDVPITTNLMGTFRDFNYIKVAEALDFVSNDMYPDWHGEQAVWREAVNVSFIDDLYRSMKGGKPWILMESTPSVTNWRSIPVPKRPGMHRLASMQALAHGSDTVMYFQFRKSRGSSEKFHGAVVDHVGHENTRVFRDVAQVGADMAKLSDLAGASTAAEVAVIYDWESEWVISSAQGPRNEDKNYEATVMEHYLPLWKLNVPVDVIDPTKDLSPYKLVIAPMMMMIRPGVAESIEKFVEAGGTFVATYLTGIVNEDDLCFLTGFPGPLRKLLGIWVEETDVLRNEHSQSVIPAPGNPMGLPEIANARQLCDIVHLEGAEALAVYGEQFYAGSPAVTKNAVGSGAAYYIASRNDEAFNASFIGTLVRTLGIERTVATDTPEGVHVQKRSTDTADFLFVLNFSPDTQSVALDVDGYTDRLTGILAVSPLQLPVFGVAVLAKQR
ncbi:MAG TPA: beta-galactosidase [Capsulimonadaceae bacterium]|jgi:beta-galactosidase